MQEPKKQIVTREIIEKEIEIKRKNNIKSQIWLFAQTLIFLLIIIYCYAIYLDYSRFYNVLLAIIIAVVYVLCAIVSIRQIFYYFNSDKFEISIEEVTETFKMPIRFTFFERVYRVYFRTKLCFSPSISTFGLDDETALREANVGDKFYVVGRGRKAYCIFNTKFCELDEELQKELRN